MSFPAINSTQLKFIEIVYTLFTLFCMNNNNKKNMNGAEWSDVVHEYENLFSKCFPYRYSIYSVKRCKWENQNRMWVHEKRNANLSRT